MKNGPELIIISEKEKGKSFLLTSKAHTLGRSSSSDICIQDPSVSSIHCDFIRTDSGGYILKDMDSTNGSKVNDKYIKSIELRNGDILRIGKTELLYSLENSASFTPESKTIIDLANVEDYEPIAPKINCSEVKKETSSERDKLFSKVTIFLAVLLAIAIICLIVWIFAIS